MLPPPIHSRAETELESSTGAGKSTHHSKLIFVSQTLANSSQGEQDAEGGGGGVMGILKLQPLIEN